MPNIVRAAGKGGAKGAARGKMSKGKRSAAGSVDEALMAKMGETIQGMKEDFIIVHLREPCSFCRKYISKSTRLPLHTPLRSMSSG